MQSTHKINIAFRLYKNLQSTNEHRQQKSAHLPSSIFLAYSSSVTSTSKSKIPLYTLILNRFLTYRQLQRGHFYGHETAAAAAEEQLPHRGS